MLEAIKAVLVGSAVGTPSISGAKVGITGMYTLGRSPAQVNSSQRQGEPNLQGPWGSSLSNSNPGRQQGYSLELAVVTMS